jgi:hypothetical protein
VASVAFFIGVSGLVQGGVSVLGWSCWSAGEMWFFWRVVGVPVVVLLVGGDLLVGLHVVERVVVFRRALVASVCGRVGDVLGLVSLFVIWFSFLRRIRTMVSLFRAGEELLDLCMVSFRSNGKGWGISASVGGWYLLAVLGGLFGQPVHWFSYSLHLVVSCGPGH